MIFAKLNSVVEVVVAVVVVVVARIPLQVLVLVLVLLLALVLVVVLVLAEHLRRLQVRSLRLCATTLNCLPTTTSSPTVIAAEDIRFGSIVMGKENPKP